MKAPCPLVVLALCLGLLPAAPAQSVPLGHAVPKDAHVVIHGVASESPDPGMAAIERALERLVERRVLEDLIELSAMDLPAEKAEQVRATFDHVLGLLGKVDWAGLMAREVLFAERLAMPVGEYMLICRVPEDRVESHLAGMRAMLEGFASMIGPEVASVEDVERRTGNMIVLEIRGAPVQVAVGAAGDAVILSLGAQSTAAAMRRLQDGGQGSLLQDEGFRASLEQLPVGTEGSFYADVDGLMGFASQVLQLAAGAASSDPRAEMMVALGRAVIDELDLIDHIAVTTASDGTTVTDTTRIRFKPGYEESRLAQLCAKQQPWTDWHRYVPADATAFYFDSGIDAGGLIDWLTDLAVDASGGPEQAGWARSGAFAHLREIVGHVSGESACVSFPCAGVDGCALGETVVMLRLEKTDGVGDCLRRHLDHFARFATGRGQKVEVSSTEGMHALAIDALPWIRPVLGVRDGMLVAATSPAALERIARVQRGEAPDIRSSTRFAALGLQGSGHYIDYRQIDSVTGGIDDLLGAAGFFLSMLPRDRDTAPAIKAGALLAKVAAALRELDLSLDTGSVLLPPTSPDAALMRRVTRYR